MVFNYLKDTTYPGYAFTGNGGNTWPDTGCIAYDGFDPSCAFDEDGNAYYAFVKRKTASQSAGIYVAKKGQGSSFDSDTTCVYSGNGVDKPYIVVDNNDDNVRDNNIYVVWSRYSKLFFSYSTDRGDSFSTPPDTIDDPPTDISAIGAVPAVGKDSDVYLVWLRINVFKDTADVYFNKWDKDSTSFKQNNMQEIADVDSAIESYSYCSMRIWSIPTIAVDVSQTGDDHIYVAYTQHRVNDVGDFDIYYVKSTNAGTDWDNTPSPAVAYDSSKEFHPWLTVTPQGEICLAFATNLNCSGSCSDLYLAYGSSMGNLDTLAITSECEVRAMGQGFYDYIGIASTDGFAYPCWTQKTASDSGVYLALVDFPPVKPTGLTLDDETYDYPYLTWDSNPEDDIAVYEIWRYPKTSKYVHGPWSKIDSTTETSYIDSLFYLDPDGPVKVKYKIRAKDDSAQYSPYSDETPYSSKGWILEQKALASRLTLFSLFPNSPNPFNPETKIEYTLPEVSWVTLTVYNILGQVVKVLVDSEQQAGYYEIQWNGEGLASGVYFYRLTAGEFTDTKRMVLMK
ncbi:MAG: T9SS type A sorting domain-containing protein [Gemmatimonadota bacterium]|nr:MAG: T9SS type A sorting domain-containing protein [Gemmatimonadota bacterium]